MLPTERKTGNRLLRKAKNGSVDDSLLRLMIRPTRQGNNFNILRKSPNTQKIERFSLEGSSIFRRSEIGHIAIESIKYLYKMYLLFKFLKIEIFKRHSGEYISNFSNSIVLKF